ncbi:MAG: hypothetical protein GXO82_06670 [Chlorobi bacterium]|nr:hypothetical protein [Chlorobiota bacterium]
MKTPVRIAILALSILFYSGCQESTGPEEVLSRFVYYAVTDTASGVAGVYRIPDEAPITELVTNVPAVFLTNVAENGIVVMQFIPGAYPNLQGRCESGTLITVPFPSSPFPQMTYGYLHKPRPVLNYQGHRFAYPVGLAPVTGFTAPERSTIVSFKCDVWKMTLLQVDSLIRKELRQWPEVTNGEIGGNSLCISSDGVTIYFTAMGTRLSGDVRLPVKSFLAAIGADGGGFRRIGEVEDPGDAELCAFNEQTNRLIVQTRKGFRSVDVNSGTYKEFPLKSVPTNASTSLSAGTFVVAGTDGVELREAVNGSIIKTVITPSAVQAHLKKTVHAVTAVAISPDGKRIAFTATLDGAGSRVAILSIDSDGTNLRTLSPDIGAAAAAVVISNPVKP